MMAGQIALSMVLVVAAVLFSRTLINLQRVEVGFDADRLATFMLEPGRSGYDRPRAEELYARIEERLRGIPGVRAVAIAGSGSGMLWGTDSNADVFLDGRASPGNRGWVEVSVRRQELLRHDGDSTPAWASVHGAGYRDIHSRRDRLGIVCA